MYPAHINALYNMQGNPSGGQQNNPPGMIPGNMAMNRPPPSGTNMPPSGQVYGGAPLTNTAPQPSMYTNPAQQLGTSPVLNQAQQNQASLHIASLQNILNTIQRVQQQTQHLAAATSQFAIGGPPPPQQQQQGPPRASFVPQLPPPANLPPPTSNAMYRPPPPQQFMSQHQISLQPQNSERPFVTQSTSQYQSTTVNSSSFFKTTVTQSEPSHRSTATSQFPGSSIYGEHARQDIIQIPDNLRQDNIQTSRYSAPRTSALKNIPLTSVALEPHSAQSNYMSTTQSRSSDPDNIRTNQGDQNMDSHWHSQQNRSLGSGKQSYNQRNIEGEVEDEEDVAGVFSKKPVSIIKKEEPAYVKINLKYQADKLHNDLGDEDDSWKYCQLCNIRFAEKKHYQVHCNGLLHSQKLSLVRKPQKEYGIDRGKPVPGQEKLVTPSSVIYRSTSRSERPPDSHTVFQNVGKHQQTSPISQPRNVLQQRRKYAEVDSDSEYMPGEELGGGHQSGSWMCRLCNIEKFLSQSSFNKHVSSNQHCQKYLRQQALLGFEKFYLEFGEIPFGGIDSNMPDESMDIMNHMELMVYRSGVVNKIECRICDLKCPSMTVWKQHIYGKRHLKRSADLINKHGREKFALQYGDIPITDETKLKEMQIVLATAQHTSAPVNIHQQAPQMSVPPRSILRPPHQPLVQQVVNIPTAVSQPNIMNAAFKQGAHLTKVPLIPFTRAAIPVIRPTAPRMVMVPTNQIEVARAQAQAQGLLPQTQQMPLQEQLEVIGSTVPKKIDIRPTKDMAELHSELQKQLLGAEIVPPSKIEDRERENQTKYKKVNPKRQEENFDYRPNLNNQGGDYGLDNVKSHRDDYKPKNLNSHRDEYRPESIKRERNDYRSENTKRERDDYRLLRPESKKRDDYRPEINKRERDAYRPVVNKRERDAYRPEINKRERDDYRPEYLEDQDDYRVEDRRSHRDNHTVRNEKNYKDDYSAENDKKHRDSYRTEGLKGDRHESRMDNTRSHRDDNTNRMKKSDDIHHDEYDSKQRRGDDDHYHRKDYRDGDYPYDYHQEDRRRDSRRSPGKKGDYKSFEDHTDIIRQSDTPVKSQHNIRAESRERNSDLHEYSKRYSDEPDYGKDDYYTHKDYSKHSSRSPSKDQYADRKGDYRKLVADKYDIDRRHHDHKPRADEYDSIGYSPNRHKEEKRRYDDKRYSPSRQKLDKNDDKPKRSLREGQDRHQDRNNREDSSSRRKDDDRSRKREDSNRNEKSNLSRNKRDDLRRVQDDHRSHSKDTVRSKESTNKSRNEDFSRRKDYRSRDQDVSDIISNKEEGDRRRSHERKRDHQERRGEYDDNRRKANQHSFEDDTNSRHRSLSKPKEEIDKPRDLREVIEESRKVESTGTGDLRLKLSQKRLSTDVDVSTSKDYDQRLEVEKAIVVEVGGSDNRDTDYRKVYVPHEAVGDEDLRLHIERKHRDHESFKDLDERYHHWESEECQRPRGNEDEDWREHMERQNKLYQRGLENPRHEAERYIRREEYGQRDPYHRDIQDCDLRKEMYSEDHDVEAYHNRELGWEGKGEGESNYKDDDYRGQSYSHRRDCDDRPALKEDFGEAGRRARSGILDEELKETSKNKPVGQDVKGAMQIFTNTLQQFISMLHGKQAHGSTTEVEKDPFQNMSEEEIQSVRQVQEMTGIADIKIAANAMRVFSTMNPKLIQMIGQLGPDTIQELISGNPHALESLPNYDAIRSGITDGTIDTHQMQYTMEKYGFGRVGHEGNRRGGARSQRREDKNVVRPDDRLKRNYHGRGRGGPVAKRGRY